MSQNKFVYAFAEGDGKNKKLLGGKGANLCEMTQIGLNVPPGFTITTETCLNYIDAGNRLPAGLMDQVRSHMAQLEKATGKGFGSAQMSGRQRRDSHNATFIVPAMPLVAQPFAYGRDITPLHWRGHPGWRRNTYKAILAPDGMCAIHCC